MSNIAPSFVDGLQSNELVLSTFYTHSWIIPNGSNIKLLLDKENDSFDMLVSFHATDKKLYHCAGRQRKIEEISPNSWKLTLDFDLEQTSHCLGDVYTLEMYLFLRDDSGIISPMNLVFRFEIHDANGMALEGIGTGPKTNSMQVFLPTEPMAALVEK